MSGRSFSTPVGVVFDGEYVYVGDTSEAVRFLERWPAERRGPVHRCALNSCLLASHGAMKSGDARRSFESFARITGILLEGIDTVRAMPRRPGIGRMPPPSPSAAGILLRSRKGHAAPVGAA
jgi:hypothetical protein